MTTGQTLRALVNKRLSAAAEEIFALFEKTVAEYEEELCRSKNENQRKQRLLDAVLNPRVLLPRAEGRLQMPSLPPHPPDPGPNQESTQTAWIKEEPEELRIKQEEELPVFVPELSSACVKRNESSVSPLTQTEHQEETQKDMDSAPHFHSETEGDTELSSDTDSDDDCSSTDSDDDSSSTDSDEDGINPLIHSEADGVHYNQVQIRDRSSALQNSGLFVEYQCAPETSAIINTGYMSGTDEGTDTKKHECSVCQKRCRSKLGLDLHSRVHKEDHCSICHKKNTQKIFWEDCTKTHTSGKPLICSICKRTFAQMGRLKVHMRTHSGEKPHSCAFCRKTFSQKCNLNVHLRLHTGEKPYSCSYCNKDFTSKWNLKSHMKSHTKRNQS